MIGEIRGCQPPESPTMLLTTLAPFLTRWSRFEHAHDNRQTRGEPAWNFLLTKDLFPKY